MTGFPPIVCGVVALALVAPSHLSADEAPGEEDTSQAAPQDSAKPAPAVAAAKQADDLARASLSLIPALFHTDVNGPFDLGWDVPGFADRGDAIWEVRFRMGLLGEGGVFQSVWVSSTTGKTRRMLPESNLPRIVQAEVERDAVARDKAIPLSVTITNRFPEPIVLGKQFAIRPASIERDGKPVHFKWEHPGDARRAPRWQLIRLAAGESKTFPFDARNWELCDGWVPGDYRISLCVDGVELDRFVTTSVCVDPVAFKIR